MRAELQDFIVTVPGVFSPDQCKRLIAENNPSVKRALVAGNKVHESRTCSQIVVPPSHEIDNGVVGAMLEYRKAFPNCKVSAVTSYVFLKYETGQFYKQHVDSFPDKPRLMTISIALNDDFEGGEWAWFDRAVTKRFRTGDAVLFPSNFMFPHEITSVTKGVRYALITWFTE
jgi:predicted 2-oxoglutarate/Fe(II)-dependent dioxygenase YbiX